MRIKQNTEEEEEGRSDPRALLPWDKKRYDYIQHAYRYLYIPKI